MSKWYDAGFEHKDAMREKAEKMFGDLTNSKRARIQESSSTVDATPVRKFAKGGAVKKADGGLTMRPEGEGRMQAALRDERGGEPLTMRRGMAPASVRPSEMGASMRSREATASPAFKKGGKAAGGLYNKSMSEGAKRNDSEVKGKGVPPMARGGKAKKCK